MSKSESELGQCDRQRLETTRAVVRVVLTNGGILEFCGHHWLEFGPRLEKGGAILLEDNRKSLYTK